jgi:hypothetical protein
MKKIINLIQIRYYFIIMSFKPKKYKLFEYPIFKSKKFKRIVRMHLLRTKKLIFKRKKFKYICFKRCYKQK